MTKLWARDGKSGLIILGGQKEVSGNGSTQSHSLVQQRLRRRRAGRKHVGDVRTHDEDIAHDDEREMDLVLHIADDILFDKVWAVLVPSPRLHASATNASAIFHPSTSPLPVATFPASSAWPRDYIPRQLLSLSVITLVGIHGLYFIFAGLSYKFIFNHDMMRHPRFLKNQIKLEIQCSLKAFPGMMLLTLPWFQAEVMGYSRLYNDIGKYGWFYFFALVPLCASLLAREH
jgi:hypothetical protein